MMKKLIYILLLGFQITIYAQGNDFSKAIIMDDSGIKDKIFKKLHEESMGKLLNLGSGNILYYNWNSKDQTIRFSEINKIPEKPSEVAIFMKAFGGFKLDPKFEMTTDTNGKATAAYFVLEGEVKYFCKHIDVVTSRIIKNETINIQKLTFKNLAVDNFEKEFGGDPGLMKKNNSRQFETSLSKLREKYQSKIESEYAGDFFLKVSLSRLSGNILSGSQEYFKVIPPTGAPEKKVRKVSFNGGAKDNIVLNDNYKLYTKLMIGDYHYYEDIATVYVHEIGESQSTAQTLLFASKDIGTAIANKEEILMAKENNIFVFNQLNSRPGDPKVNIAIKKNCMFCDEEFENQIYECPVFALIERNAPELKYFNNLTKDERFIDYSVEDLQGKQVGYQLLLTQDGDYYQIIETATNKNISSFKKRVKAVDIGPSNGNSFNFSSNALSQKKLVPDIGQADIQRFLLDYKPEIYKVQWILTLEEKKEKVEKIAVYHPAGMDRYMEYNFYTLASEEVDGEKIERKVKIGRGKIGKSISPNIAELKIKDGEKEIFKAKKNNEKILIEVSDNTRI